MTEQPQHKTRAIVAAARATVAQLEPLREAARMKWPLDPFRGARPWTARVRRGPSGEVVITLGGTDMVMAEDQADRLSVLLRSVSTGNTDDTGAERL